MSQQSGYKPLLHDVRDVVVPSKWRGCEYEYRHGYGKGLEADGVMNPVTHRAALAAFNCGEPDPRDAWFAGYAKGKQARTAEGAP